MDIAYKKRRLTPTAGEPEHIIHFRSWLKANGCENIDGLIFQECCYPSSECSSTERDLSELEDKTNNLKLRGTFAAKTLAENSVAARIPVSHHFPCRMDCS